MNHRYTGCLATLVALSLSAASCGGVTFSRSDGAPRYKALWMKASDVKVYDAASQIPPRHQVLGSIAVTRKISDPAAAKPRVVETFATIAKKRGCNALSELKSSVTDGERLVKERVKGPHGQVRIKKSTKTVKQVRWVARCIRTEAARGGLKPWRGSGAPAVTAAPTTSAPPKPRARPSAPPTVPKASQSRPGLSKTSPASPSAPTRPETPSVPSAPTVPGAPPVPATSAPSPPSAKPPGALPILTPGAQSLWRDLSVLQKTYLPDMADAFKREPTTSLEVVRAVARVMYAVVGSEGFWRKTVPTKWFGCSSNPTSDACGKLSRANAKLRPYEALANDTGNLEVQTASAWLTRHEARIGTFLRDVTPRSLDLTGMKNTPFFKQHFAL